MFWKKKEIDLKAITNKIEFKNLLFRVSVLLLALYVSAFNYNLFILPSKFVTGGSSGIGTLFNVIFNIDASFVISIIMYTTLILAFIFFGVKKAMSIVLVTIIYPIFVKLAGEVTSLINIDLNNKLLISIFAGIIDGTTTGLVLKMGFGPGGMTTISQIMYEKFKISISKVNLFMNTIIVSIGGIFIGFDKVMYAIIILYIASIMVDKVIIGISNSKLFTIVTEKEKEVISLISTLKHSSTVLDGKGGTEINKSIIMCNIPTKEYFIVKEAIKEIDKNAFFTVSDSYEVFGGK